MKILSVEQLQNLDQYTIDHEPISSLKLMERAALACVDWIMDHFSTAPEYVVICGPGNNGGDGLAMGRLLAHMGRSVVVYADRYEHTTSDYTANYERLAEAQIIAVPLREFDFTEIREGAIVIDAMFGYGLNRPLAEHWEQLASVMNSLPNLIISIDMPSGVFADKQTTGTAVCADFTLTFQSPKLAFFIPENQDMIGEWRTLDIGLDVDELERLPVKRQLLNRHDVETILPKRRKFDHKGNFGHALLVVGSYGKMGAAILSARAAIRSGAGLVTVHVPRMADHILQITVPEVMVSSDHHDFNFSGIKSLSGFSAVGLGCGLGLYEGVDSGIASLFKEISVPIVIDADGLNAMARIPQLLEKLPRHSILTPHFKEFARLFGESENHFVRLEKLQEAAQKHKVIIVLKGANTAIAMEDGSLVFNPTGNPGMATAGSGDVLAGLITGLLAKGMSPGNAAKAGVYLHGLAGDLAVQMTGEEALIASDIIDHLGHAFKTMHKK